MNRLLLMLPLLALSLALLPLAQARGEEPTWRVAMILWRGETDAERGFKEYLAEREAKIDYKVYDCGRNEALARDAIAAINRDKPDLVYTFSTTPTIFAAGRWDRPGEREVIDPSLPIVFTIVGDAVGVGLVKSLAGHGRNLTGVSHMVPLDIQLPVLRQTAPFKTLGFIHDARAESSTLLRADMAAAGAKLDFTLRVEAVDTSGPLDQQLLRLDEAAARLAADKPDAVYIPSDSFVIPNAARITKPLTAAGIPTFAATEEPVRAGGALMGVVGRYRAVGRFAAAKALRILRDKVPAKEIPIEPLPRYGVVLNLATARALQIFPPLDILNLAEPVGLPLATH